MPEQGRGNVRWFLVFWLFILSAVSFLDRVNISVAGSAIASEYHLGQVQLGWVFSAFLWGYALFQTFGGWLADRLGPRRVLAGGVLWWGIFTALTAAVSPAIAGAVFLFVLVRFLLGAGEAIIFPASNQFISRWIPTQERGIANGLIFAGVGAGAGSAPAIVTYIMVHYGWRWPEPNLRPRRHPEEHASVSAGELLHIQHGRSAARPSVPVRNSEEGTAPALSTGPIPWSIILRSKEVWLVTLSYFCFGYVAWIFFSWFYIYLGKVRGLDLKASAFYSTFPPLAMVACSLLGGAINDRLTKTRGKRLGRCSIAVFALFLAAILLVIGAHVSSARIASIVLAGGAGALYLAQSSYWSVTADIAGPSAGSASGFMNMGAQLGGAVTALLTPVIAVHLGWTYPFIVAATLSAFGAVAWLAVDPARNLDRLGQSFVS